MNDAASLKWWNVEIYAFGDDRFQAKSKDAARYLAFKAMRESGYFRGRDGFHRFLVQGVFVSPVKEPRP